jgi:hypothetical protein
MIYLYTEYHLLGSNDMLVIAIQPKPKYKFLAHPVLLHFILKANYLKTVAYFSKVYCHTSFQDPVLGSASVTHFMSLCFCHFLCY